LQGKGKGKGKARKVSFDEGGDDDEAEAEAEDNRFEQQHRESILAGLEEKRKVHGVRVSGFSVDEKSYSCMLVQGIAEHGIIESIEMHQFMCHKFLTFTFGPQINFIIGVWMLLSRTSRVISYILQVTMEVRIQCYSE
jgi:hypothetical protein